jgi:DNA invertase Pin-like site-specific DNA recombinase
MPRKKNEDNPIQTATIEKTTRAPFIADLPPEKTLHIYTRVSTEGQRVEGTSLETQYEEGVKRAEQYGLLYRHWDEGGVSSNHEEISERPKLNALFHSIKSGEIKHLFVYDQSRLSRNDLVASVFRYECRRNGVTIYTKDGKYNLSNPSDNLLTQLMNAVAEFDNSVRSDKVRRGRIKKSKLGFWQGAVPPFGYKLIDQRLVLNPDEAKWVKEVFEYRANGMKVTEIARYLNAHHVKPRFRNNWSHSSIRVMMQNTHCMGYYTVLDRVNGGEFRINCEAIVSEELWRKANSIINKEWVRRLEKTKNRTSILFRSITFCGHCGLRFSIYDSSTTSTTLYYCPHKQREYAKLGRGLFDKKHRMGCGMDKGIRVDIFEREVIKAMTDAFGLSDVYKKRFEQTVMSGHTIIMSPYHLRHVKTQLAELVGARNSISELVERSEIVTPHELREREGLPIVAHKHRVRIKDLTEEIEKINLRLDERDRYIQFCKWLANSQKTLSKFAELSHDDKRNFVYEVIDGIEVRFNREEDSHSLKVIFRSPLIGAKNIKVSYVRTLRRVDKKVIQVS